MRNFKRLLSLTTISFLFFFGAAPANAHLQNDPGRETDETREVSGEVVVVLSETYATEFDPTTGEEISYSFIEGRADLYTRDGEVIELADTGTHDFYSGQKLTVKIDANDEFVAIQQMPPVARSIYDENYTPAKAVPRPHIVDVVHYRNSATENIQTADVHALMQRLSDYWVRESGGQISGITLGQTRLNQIPPGVTSSSSCADFKDSWDAAIDLLGEPENGYTSNSGTGSVKHLLVIASNDCALGGGSGVAQVGHTVHSGGAMWVAVGRASTDANNTKLLNRDAVFFHEFGHNVSLVHASDLRCGGTAIDTYLDIAVIDIMYASPAPQDGDCKIYEYYDSYDVMGVSRSIPGVILDASTLNLTNREFLGSYEPGQLESLSAPAGQFSEHVVTLRPTSEIADVSIPGPIGLKIKDPDTGVDYYVEYRAGSDSDENTFYSRAQVSNNNINFMPGVRVLRAIPINRQTGGTGVSYSAQLNRNASVQEKQLMQNPAGGTFNMNQNKSQLPYYVQGTVFKPYSESFEVTVLSIDPAAGAELQIQFSPELAGVLSPPVFAMQPASKEAVVGNNAVFAVATTGNPAPTVTWEYRVNASGTWKTVTSTVGTLSNGNKTLTVPADLNKNGYQFRAKAVNSEGTVTSSAVNLTVKKKTITAGSVKIAASPKVGDTLTAETKNWSPTGLSYKYEWLRDGKKISGASGKTYKVVAADEGKKLSVKVTASKTNYNNASKTSNVVTVAKTVKPEPSKPADPKPTDPAKPADKGTGVNQGGDKTSAWVAPVTNKPRLAGGDRFGTAAEISAATFKSGVPVVYIANGLNFPDALAGAAVAGMKGSPVLLTTATGMTAEVEAELRRLQPKQIIVLGGTGVISSSLMNKLKGFTKGSVKRLSGNDRFGTAAEISRASFGANVDTVYIANGLNFPDALAGAAVAGKNNAPVLLTSATGMTAEVEKELKRLNPKQIIVLGGPGVITPAFQNTLKGFARVGVNRLADTDRFGTAAAISKASFTTPGVPVVYVASGMDFPDALAGAAAAGTNNAPVLLVTKNGIPAEVAAELKRLAPKKVVVLGGAGVVNNSVQKQLKSYEKK